MRNETQYLQTPLTLTDGQVTTALCDTNGRSQVAEQYAPQAEDNTNGVIAQALKPLSTSTYSASLYTNFAAAVTQNIKASAGNVMSFVCRNNNTGTRYIQFHDTATTPAGAAVPKLTFQVPGNAVNGGVFSLGRDFFGQMGLFFTNGIAMAFSTTEATYTAGAAGDVTLHVTYK